MLICEPLLKELSTKFNTGPASCYAEMVWGPARVGIPVVRKACGNKKVPPVRLSQFDRFSQLLNVTATRASKLQNESVQVGIRRFSHRMEGCYRIDATAAGLFVGFGRK